MSASESEDPAEQLAAMQTEIAALQAAPCDTPGRAERLEQLEEAMRTLQTIYAPQLGLIGPRPTAADHLRHANAPRRTKLTASEAARLAGCSLPTLKSADDDLTPHRVGAIGIRVYDGPTVESWAQARRDGKLEEWRAERAPKDRK